MEVQCTPLSWDFFHEDEVITEQLWHSLLHKTLELETRVASAKEEITKKEDELVTLKNFLSRAVKERDEAESKCQSIMSDIVSLQQQQQQQQEQEQASRVVDQPKPLPEIEKPLPEKGRLLEAVMEAGPLLQTLLLAGPLPRWQHPPPRVDAGDIPPVAISARPPQNLSRQDSNPSCLGHKRSLPHSDGSAFPYNSKCQKVALH